MKLRTVFAREFGRLAQLTVAVLSSLRLFVLTASAAAPRTLVRADGRSARWVLLVERFALQLRVQILHLRENSLGRGGSLLLPLLLGAARGVLNGSVVRIAN